MKQSRDLIITEGNQDDRRKHKKSSFALSCFLPKYTERRCADCLNIQE